ncbi:hypothetical protein FHL15_002538 [Xylaria flabelliformis]|uniref:Mid2 domain-containing protein n=1 Tax=Xylaria flabelliformis TaxID=2512241 RepID=A0A553I8V0_9PEZI|nr:hypothetical protein FHL15_002538 [Xylaria flabelliformis]
MRRHLITLVLTTGTLVSTDAIQPSTLTGNKDSALLSRREPGPASESNVLDRRNYISHSPPEINFIKRDRKSRYTARDKNDKDDEDDKDEDEYGDDESDDKNPKYHTGDHSPQSTQLPWPPSDGPQNTYMSSSSTSILTSSMTTRTNPPSTVSSSSSTIPVATPTQTPPTGLNTGVSDGDGGGRDDPLNPTDSKGGGDDHDGDENNNDSHSKTTVRAAAISVSIVGGLLLILILLLAWYWFAVRPKRRERLTVHHMVLPKDSDLESHVTVDLRNGPGSSSDGLSSHAMSTGTLGHVPAQGQHVVVESAARSLSNLPSPGVAQAEPYAAVTRGSPTANNAPFMDAYAAPHPAYSQDLTGSYSPVENPQGVIRPNLETDAFPGHVGSASTAMELDGRPPPPRYPDAIAAVQVPGSSPTSPLPVSPLSPISPHLGPHALTADEPQYHPQQYQGPRQPSYGDYEPSSLPEVVSPICQLGQTSASLPEYDEAAETARLGSSNHNNLMSQHHLQGGDEKQALSSQQPMTR